MAQPQNRIGPARCLQRLSLHLPLDGTNVKQPLPPAHVKYAGCQSAADIPVVLYCDFVPADCPASLQVLSPEKP